MRPAEWISSQLVQIPAGQSILDAGAGQGQYRKHCAHLRYTPQDAGRYDGKDEGKWEYQADTIISDICDIPVSAGSFDAVLCTDVFEHILNPLAAVHEFHRILRVGGVLIMLHPFSCNTHQEPYFFNSGVHRNWYREVMAHNFEITNEYCDGNFWTQLTQEVDRAIRYGYKYSHYSWTQAEKADLEKALLLFAKAGAQDAGSNSFVCGSYGVRAEKK